MPWTGASQNLYDFFMNNINDMKKGIVEQGGLNNTNLLILIANSIDKSHLINVTYRDGKCYNDTLKTYDDGAMETAEKMTTLLNKVAEVAPAHVYSMMIGSHGVGWIYAKTASASMQRRIAADRDRNEAMGLPITRQTRYFGGGAVQMNIDELAEGIRRSKINHLQFLLFDDCYMANIETAYELNRVTDYLIGCPTEIMGHGMPYREMWKYLSPTQPDYKNAVEAFYNFYSNYSIGSIAYHYGTISVTDCRKVDAMMGVLDTVHNKYRMGTDVGSALQVLDGYVPVIFFDFSDYIHRLCAGDAELTKRFDDALSQLVPYERHTEYYFSSLTNAGSHRIKTCSGLTISAPSKNSMVVSSKPKSHFYALFR
ncbi:clostripain-related cysteine peptidase [Prevotella falsenii]